jgi:hypothetical protein
MTTIKFASERLIRWNAVWCVSYQLTDQCVHTDFNYGLFRFTQSAKKGLRMVCRVDKECLLPSRHPIPHLAYPENRVNPIVLFVFPTGFMKLFVILLLLLCHSKNLAFDKLRLMRQQSFRVEETRTQWYSVAFQIRKSYQHPLVVIRSHNDLRIDWKVLFFRLTVIRLSFVLSCYDQALGISKGEVISNNVLNVITIRNQHNTKSSVEQHGPQTERS